MLLFELFGLVWLLLITIWIKDNILVSIEIQIFIFSIHKLSLLLFRYLKDEIQVIGLPDLVVRRRLVLSLLWHDF